LKVLDLNCNSADIYFKLKFEIPEKSRLEQKINHIVDNVLFLSSKEYPKKCKYSITVCDVKKFPDIDSIKYSSRKVFKNADNLIIQIFLSEYDYYVFAYKGKKLNHVRHIEVSHDKTILIKEYYRDYIHTETDILNGLLLNFGLAHGYFGYGLLHSCGFIINNEAYLILGNSGEGKSTLIKSLLDHGILNKSDILGDERVLLSFNKVNPSAILCKPFNIIRSNITTYSKFFSVKRFFILKRGEHNLIKRIDIDEIKSFILEDKANSFFKRLVFPQSLGLYDKFVKRIKEMGDIGCFILSVKEEYYNDSSLVRYLYDEIRSI